MMEKKFFLAVIILAALVLTITSVSSFSSIEPTIEQRCGCVWDNINYSEWEQKCYRGFKYECRCRGGCTEWEYVSTCN